MGSSSVEMPTEELASHGHNSTTSRTSLVGYFSIPNNPKNAAAHYDGGGIVQKESNYNAKYAGADSDDWGRNFKIDASHNHTVTIGNSGGNTAHENRPPYIVIYRWRRTS